MLWSKNNPSVQEHVTKQFALHLNTPAIAIVLELNALAKIHVEYTNRRTNETMENSAYMSFAKAVGKKCARKTVKTHSGSCSWVSKSASSCFTCVSCPGGSVSGRGGGTSSSSKSLTSSSEPGSGGGAIFCSITYVNRLCS